MSGSNDPVDLWASFDRLAAFAKSFLKKILGRRARRRPVAPPPPVMRDPCGKRGRPGPDPARHPRLMRPPTSGGSRPRRSSGSTAREAGSSRVGAASPLAGGGRPNRPGPPLPCRRFARAVARGPGRFEFIPYDEDLTLSGHLLGAPLLPQLREVADCVGGAGVA